MRTTLSKLSPGGTAESYPGHGPGLADPNHEWFILELEVPQDCILEGFSAVPSGLIAVNNPTQDYVLGYSQPSLRD